MPFLYDTLFNRLEKVRWNLNEDIPWHQLEPEKIPPNYLKQLKVVCMAEFTALDATMMFLRDFFDDLDFSCFMSVWYYEEMKHHYVLRRYLEACGVSVTEQELKPLHQSLPFGGIIPTLTMHMIGEVKLYNWYKAVEDFSQEPVSEAIFRNMAMDELRHSQAYFEFLERHIARDPTVLGSVLRMARFMFKEEQGNVKHPVPQLVEGTAEFNFNDAITGVFASLEGPIREANRRAERTVFRLLSKLSGMEISDEASLSRAIKQDKIRQRASAGQSAQASA